MVRGQCRMVGACWTAWSVSACADDDRHRAAALQPQTVLDREKVFDQLFARDPVARAEGLADVAQQKDSDVLILVALGKFDSGCARDARPLASEAVSDGEQRSPVVL